METYKFIANVKELKWFYDNCVPELEADEVYYCSLGARKKRLTEEEREKYLLKHAQMFEKTIIKRDGWLPFFEAISKFECNKNGHLTKTGLPYPDKSLVVYWNINPTSSRKCLGSIKQKCDIASDELLNAALKHSKDGVEQSQRKLRNIFGQVGSVVAQNQSKRYWMDFDLDIEHVQSYDDLTYTTVYCVELPKLLNELFGVGNTVIIKCAGGFHILVRKDAMNKNPNDVAKSIEQLFVANGFTPKECIRNVNSMIPLPGTYQYGEFEVYVVNRETLKLNEIPKHSDNAADDNFEIVED